MQAISQGWLLQGEDHNGFHITPLNLLCLFKLPSFSGAVLIHQYLDLPTPHSCMIQNDESRANKSMGRQTLVITHYPHNLIPLLIRDTYLLRLRKNNNKPSKNEKRQCQTPTGFVYCLNLSTKGPFQQIVYVNHFQEHARSLQIDFSPPRQPFALFQYFMKLH